MYLCLLPPRLFLREQRWLTEEEFRTHVMASWPEYNHRYAHPFDSRFTVETEH